MARRLQDLRLVLYEKGAGRVDVSGLSSGSGAFVDCDGQSTWNQPESGSSLLSASAFADYAAVGARDPALRTAASLLLFFRAPCDPSGQFTSAAERSGDRDLREP